MQVTSAEKLGGDFILTEKLCRAPLIVDISFYDFKFVIPATYPDAGLRRGSLRQVRGKLRQESRTHCFYWIPAFAGMTCIVSNAFVNN